MSAGSPVARPGASVLRLGCRCLDAGRMRALALSLLLAGAALEIVGLVVTFRELRSRLRAVVDYEQRPITVYAHGIGAVTWMGRATVTVDPPPSLEQQVADLKRSIEQLHEEIDARTRRAEERSRKAAEDIATGVRRQVEDHLSALSALALSNAGRGRKAYAGPVLFLVGLLLQTGSNLAQLLSLD